MIELYLALSLVFLLVFAFMVLDKWQMEKDHRADVDRLCSTVDASQARLNMALDRMEEEREHWRVERQKLLDRIQAPTFGEYKQAEVKTIRAQNGEKEPPKLIQM